MIEYEKLRADFEHKLVTQLRSHGSDADFLEMWVPDDDVVKSLLNMVEAASAYGCDEIRVRVRAETLDSRQLAVLTHEIGDLGHVDVVHEDGGMLVAVKDIRTQ